MKNRRWQLIVISSLILSIITATFFAINLFVADRGMAITFLGMLLALSITLTALLIWTSNQSQTEFDTIIEERQSLQEHIEEQRGAVDSLAHGIEVSLFIVDHKAKILFANDKAMQVFKLDHTTGKTLSTVTLSTELDSMVEAVNKDKSPQTAEITFTYPEERIGIVKIWPQEKREEHLFVSIIDVTDIVRLKRIRQDFVANVSHELRTPLSIIRALAETLLDEKRPSLALREKYLGKIIGEVDRLAMISNDLLVLSSAESGPVRRQECDIAEVVKGVINQLQLIARDKKIDLVYDGLDECVIEANPTQMTQVVLNLVDNGIKYTNEGNVEVRLRKEGSSVTIEIKDSGIGIAEEHLERIFERFYRVDKARSRASGGTGLGLSIVRHIVESHGGKITVESVPDVGTTFRVILPLA